MSFLVRETSWHLGIPIELFTFEWGSNVKRYCSGGRDVTVGGVVYESAYIARDDFELTNDTIKSDLTVHVPRDNYVALQYIGWPPDDVVKLTLSCVHKGDSEIQTVWIGRIIAHQLSKDQATFTCESIYTALKRRGLRAQYSQLCRHMLYDSWCGVDKASFTETYSGAETQGVNVVCGSLASKSNGYWAGGICTNGTSGEVRFIIEHWQNVIRLQYPFKTSLSSGDITVSPGCDHLINTCVDKFDNRLNFGGFPHMITNNPFTGDKIM